MPTRGRRGRWPLRCGGAPLSMSPRTKAARPWVRSAFCLHPSRNRSRLASQRCVLAAQIHRTAGIIFLRPNAHTASRSPSTRLCVCNLLLVLSDLDLSDMQTVFLPYKHSMCKWFVCWQMMSTGADGSWEAHSVLTAASPVQPMDAAPVMWAAWSPFLLSPVSPTDLKIRLYLFSLQCTCHRPTTLTTLIRNHITVTGLPLHYLCGQHTSADHGCLC